MDFIPYKVNEYLENTFYQVPKELFTNPYYKKLNSDSILLYALLLDRLSVSRKNEWIDEDGNVFLLFARKDVEKKLKLSDEMNLIYTYNLNSKEDAQNLRMKYIEEVTLLKAEREKLRQLYKKDTNESDKTIIRAKIETITEDINKINSKIQTCKRIITNAEKGEKETILINNRALENQQNNEQ